MSIYWISLSSLPHICLFTFFPACVSLSILKPLSVPLCLLSPVSCSKVFLSVWRDSEALVQTGYSSAQGQCTGHGREGEEGGKEQRWTLHSQLRGGRQGQILRDVCPCICVCMCTQCICAYVCQLYWCICSPQLCFRGQQTSTSLLHAHLQLQMNRHPLSLLLSAYLTRPHQTTIRATHVKRRGAEGVQCVPLCVCTVAGSG